LAIIEQIRRTIGEYNFAGQYQQPPAPQGGGMVKAAWFRNYAPNERPEKFDRIAQRWDTANKASQLSDFSICTTRGSRARTFICCTCCASAWNILSPSGRRAISAEPSRRMLC
jgi:phage terminase large subunit-like protein